jgi:hypothetical protein
VLALSNRQGQHAPSYSAQAGRLSVRRYRERGFPLAIIFSIASNCRLSSSAPRLRAIRKSSDGRFVVSFFFLEALIWEFLSKVRRGKPTGGREGAVSAPKSSLAGHSSREIMQQDPS